MEVSNVFTRNLEAYNINRKHYKQGTPSPCRIAINRGGTRSTKTYSITQLLEVISIARKREGLTIEIAAKERASHKGKALKDFQEILMNEGLWNRKNFNKTDLTYQLEGNQIAFIGMDNAMKKRGQGRDILFMNEANAFSLEDWIQLKMRTKEMIFIDYNPSEYTWIDSEIIEKRDDYVIIHSTYKDNPFLPISQVREIEQLIDAGDQYYIDVYVHGIMGTFKGKIYAETNVITPEEYDAIPDQDRFYGLDFGYEHPMSLIEGKYFNEKIYKREIFHASHSRVNDDLIPRMRELGINTMDPIYCDHAYPAEIRNLIDADFNALKADKSVKPGIQFLQMNNHKTFYCNTSKNLIWERNKYKWKQDVNGRIYEGEPVKVDDDANDADRYGTYSHLKRMIGGFI